MSVDKINWLHQHPDMHPQYIRLFDGVSFREKILGLIPLEGHTK